MKAIVKVKPAAGAIVRRFDFSGVIGEFLAAQDIRELSKEVYRNGLERLLAWLAVNGISQPDRQSILRFKLYLQESGLSANSINSYLIGVRRFFAFLEGSRLYPDIAKTIKGMKQPSGQLREAPTLPQAQEILSRIDTASLPGKRDFAMINVMLRTGLRTIELVRANVEDIRQQAGEALLFIQGKGRDSKDEFVLLTEKALRPILDYLEARGKTKPEDPLFVSHSDRNSGERLTTRTIRGISKFYLREIGLNKKQLSAHSFRHFFATQSLKAGAPLLQVQESMRHASIETTRRYIHNLDRIENAAERYVDF
jgi:integrase/recombinase XerC/integrase/recombinase XerD